MSIRWIRNVLIEGEQGTVEILIGDRTISDKCYIRINSGPERWFSPKGDTRSDIISQGIELLKKDLQGKALTKPNGEPFDWE
jgi:hypothetical protein